MTTGNLGNKGVSKSTRNAFALLVEFDNGSLTRVRVFFLLREAWLNVGSWLDRGKEPSSAGGSCAS